MRRVRWILGGLVALLLLAAVGLWYAPRWLVPRIAARSPGCLYFVRTDEPVIALTIDDGPDSLGTPAILAALAEYGARATFFLISDRVRGREGLVSAIVRGGHELGNHLTRDEPSIRLSPEEFQEALLEADSVLAPFAATRWARPGGGWHEATMLTTMRRHAFRCALGSVYPYDSHVLSSRFAARYIRVHARPGAVIVLHDAGGRGERTAATLRRVLPALSQRGYRVVALSELVGITPATTLRADTIAATDTLRALGPPEPTVPDDDVPADAASPVPTAADLARLRAELTIPVAGVTAAQLLDTFDEARGSRRHDALDILAPRGTSVLSGVAGRLVRLVASDNGGLMVYATDSTERFILMYAHLDRYADALREGMPLARGQVIGHVGTTGNAPPTVPHLHFAIARVADVRRWWTGTPVNPHSLLVP
ncbi:MAG: polysaccharide deacetylase family protein [Gemmatimonadota bacterium]|nr:polysaccharide deacetylase family protein [Gemmatimonadota bacterium]